MEKMVNNWKMFFEKPDISLKKESIEKKEHNVQVCT